MINDKAKSLSLLTHTETKDINVAYIDTMVHIKVEFNETEFAQAATKLL